MSDKFDPNAHRHSDSGSPDLVPDPWRSEREAFVETWIVNNKDLSPEARDYLRALVFAENGPWNDTKNVRDVVEYADEHGVIYLCYSDDGEEVEIPFRYDVPE